MEEEDKEEEKEEDDAEEEKENYVLRFWMKSKTGCSECQSVYMCKLILIVSLFVCMAVANFIKTRRPPSHFCVSILFLCLSPP